MVAAIIDPSVDEDAVPNMVDAVIEVEDEVAVVAGRGVAEGDVVEEDILEEAAVIIVRKAMLQRN